MSEFWSTPLAAFGTTLAIDKQNSVGNIGDFVPFVASADGGSVGVGGGGPGVCGGGPGSATCSSRFTDSDNKALPPISQFGSFTRMIDERANIDNRARDITFGFDRMNIYEANPPSKSVCRPAKTMSNRNQNTALRPSMKETNADVQNYFERPPPLNKHTRGSYEPLSAAEAFDSLNLGSIGAAAEVDCPAVTETSSILDNPKENSRELNTFQFSSNQLFFDPQYPVTQDDFTRPQQTREIVKDIYKQQLCANADKKRVSYVGGKKEFLANDFASKLCKQEEKRRAGPQSILLGNATLKAIPVNSSSNASQATVSFAPAGR